MAVVPFDAEALGNFDDGRIIAYLNAELKKIESDLDDRPMVKKERTLTLQLSFSPIVDPDSRDLDGANFTFAIKSSVPNQKSQTYRLGSKVKGKLCYSPDNPEDADQKTFEEAAARRG